MALDATEIVVAGNGRILVAPADTAGPADVTAAWAAAWVDLGYADEDGVTISKSRDMGTVDAWQSFYPVRRMVTGEDFTVAFNLLQWSRETVTLAFGGGTVTEASGVFTYTPPAAGSLDERALGVEWVDGDKTYRLVLPRAMVTEGVETSIQGSEAAVLPITMGILGSAGVDPFTLVTDDPSWAAAA